MGDSREGVRGAPAGETDPSGWQDPPFFIIHMYDRKDHFYQKAKKEGLASRAAYKLTEIQKRFKIIKPRYQVLDVGCAPGGWLQILSKMVGPMGGVVGVDRLPLKISPPTNVTFLQKPIEEIDSFQNSFDVVVSDISPDLSGITFRDVYNSFELAQKVWSLTQQVLKKGGHLVIKIFPGEETNSLRNELKKSFAKFHTFVPQATRKTSSEVYWVFLEFNG